MLSKNINYAFGKQWEKELKSLSKGVYVRNNDWCSHRQHPSLIHTLTHTQAKKKSYECAEWSDN